jgi:hypothetical protein
VLLAVYCVASFVHFAHNAEFISSYPNLPASFTRSGIYISWLLVTSVGVVGVLLLRLGLRVVGLFLAASYAILGLAGLDHYALAPMSQHSLAMNATILFEVFAAAVLLIASVVLLFGSLTKRQAVGA